jgi:hypothetical protein
VGGKDRRETVNNMSTKTQTTKGQGKPELPKKITIGKSFLSQGPTVKEQVEAMKARVARAGGAPEAPQETLLEKRMRLNHWVRKTKTATDAPEAPRSGQS